MAHGVLQVDGRRARWWRSGPLDGRPLVLLAHGAGAPADSPFLLSARDGLVARGLTVVRFHFPYMQRMVDSGRRRPPDPMPRLLDTWRALLARVAGWPDAGPVVLAGKSMGGRAASLLAAAGDAPGARACVYLGYPLHPAGKPERLRREHLPDVPVPQLFLSGTADPLARLDLLRETVDGLGPGAELALVEGGDHSLARSRRRPLEDADAWWDRVAAFVAEHSGPRRRAGRR